MVCWARISAIQFFRSPPWGQRVGRHVTGKPLYTPNHHGKWWKMMENEPFVLRKFHASTKESCRVISQWLSYPEASPLQRASLRKNIQLPEFLSHRCLKNTPRQTFTMSLEVYRASTNLATKLGQEHFITLSRSVPFSKASIPLAFSRCLSMYWKFANLQVKRWMNQNGLKSSCTIYSFTWFYHLESIIVKCKKKTPCLHCSGDRCKKLENAPGGPRSVQGPSARSVVPRVEMVPSVAANCWTKEFRDGFQMRKHTVEMDWNSVVLTHTCYASWIWSSDILKYTTCSPDEEDDDVAWEYAVAVLSLLVGKWCRAGNPSCVGHPIQIEHVECGIQVM